MGRRRAARIPPTATASSIWPATCGSGSSTGTIRGITERPGREIRPVRRSGISGSSAAAAGSSPTSGCCRAATGTRCRRIRIRTRSASAWPVRCKRGVAAESDAGRRAAEYAEYAEREKMKIHLLSLVLLFGSTLPAAAQMPGPPGPPVIVTSGEGVVKQAPDRAWVTIAAESRARTAQEAQRLNTDAMTAVVEKIKAVGRRRGCDPDLGLQPAAGVRLRQQQADASRLRRAQPGAGAPRRAGEDRRSDCRGGRDRRDQRQRRALRSQGSRLGGAAGAHAGGPRCAPPRRCRRVGRRRPDRAHHPHRGTARHAATSAGRCAWRWR